MQTLDTCVTGWHPAELPDITRPWRHGGREETRFHHSDRWASAFSCAKAFAAKTLARIGILHIGQSPKELQPDLLTPALNAMGWREGETCQFEIRAANGDIASLPRLAAEPVKAWPGSASTG
jgi:hypothetical protein